MLQLILAAGLAIVVSAVCSIFEAALYSVSASHIEVLRKKNKTTGTLLKKMKQDIHRPITAILTLNTIANTMGAAIAGASAAALFGEQYLAWFSFFFTMLILTFSEILPKTIGVRYNRELAPLVARPIYWLVIIFKPGIWFFSHLAGMVLKTSSPEQTTAEEVLAIASLGRQAGAIAPHQEKVISNIIALQNTTARQAMTPRTVVVALEASMTVAEAYQMRDKLDAHSRIPLYSGTPDNVTGILLRRDVLSNFAEKKAETKLDTLKKPAHFVPETARLDRIMLDFIERRQHLFVVVDEYGTVTGVISLEDIVEEIVGSEILDESDRTGDLRELARTRGKKEKSRAGF